MVTLLNSNSFIGNGLSLAKKESDINNIAK